MEVVKTEGFAELDAALAKLPQATSRNAMRRAAKETLEPVARTAQANAPVRTGGLRERIIVSPRLGRRAAALERHYSGKNEVVMHMGPAGARAQSIANEFGTSKMAAQPYMRPAWDSHKGQLLGRLKEKLGPQIMAAAARLARKQARMAK